MSHIGPDEIRRAIERRRDEILDWTQELMRFPSENRPPNGSEGPAQEFIEAECRKLGLEVDVFSPEEVPGIEDHPSWLPGRNYANDRRNVVARRRGTGGGRSLLLSGHVDVAPFEPDDWKVCRPYEPLIRDGRLYGRGGADMKGGMAAAYWALRLLQELGWEPKGDVLFESLVDEEFASGNGTLAARLRGHNADFAMIMEPTRMEICRACFGAFLGNLTIRGAGGMPYTGSEIANPIRAAGRVIELFDEWQEMWRRDNRHPLFADPGKQLHTLLWRAETTEHGESAQMGTPLFARLGWIQWCHPGMTEEEFYGRFRAYWQEHGESDPALRSFELNVEREYHYVKPWETPSEDPAVQALVEASRQYAGKALPVSGAPFSCDLAIYGEAGMPAVLFGPRCDNLHGSDEWVEISDLLDLTGIYATLALAWCGGGSGRSS
jgi:acetylornithine deacetylase